MRDSMLSRRASLPAASACSSSSSSDDWAVMSGRRSLLKPPAWRPSVKKPVAREGCKRNGRPIGPPSYDANAGRITTKNQENDRERPITPRYRFVNGNRKLPGDFNKPMGGE